MKLYFMKQSALDYMKANIGVLYKNYYQFDSYEWIEELFDYDPFEVFDTVPDFELANTNQEKGEIDFQNCKILSLNLHLTESQASDERLWAGLCNKTFYSYMRNRWEYGKKHLKNSSKDADDIMSRYYFKKTGRSGMFRNTLARCWWTGHLTYSEKYDNHWELLDAIGANDIVSKIGNIFYSNTYSSNSVILEGFCQGLKYFRDRGTYVSAMNHIRPTAQYLNAVGGGVLLDIFSEEEIKNMVVQRIGTLIKGGDIGLAETDLDDNDQLLDEDEDNDAEEVNVDCAEFKDSLEISTKLDLEKVLGKLTEVEYGCKVHIHKMPEDDSYIHPMPLMGEKLNLLEQRLLGKPVGATVKIGQSEYEIVYIQR